jgi:tRNA G10  N-methylase Trm11
MKEYLFILGNAHQLAAFELKKILEQKIAFTDFTLSENLVTIKSAESEMEIAGLLKILGGTIKIGQLIDQGNSQEIIKNSLINNPVRNFGVSCYRGNMPKSALFSLKKELSDKGIKLRFVTGRGAVLNAAEIVSNRLHATGREFIITGDRVYRGLAVQDIKEATSRDYGKPRSDPKSGMLPPKLARMIVNISLSKTDREECLVFDPFCGSGNLLLEALILNQTVAGCDLSDRAVADTRENLNWAAKKFGLDEKKIVKISIADSCKDKFLEGVTDFKNIAVVSELFLGAPRKEPYAISSLEPVLTDLSKLYLEFLKNLQRQIVNFGLKSTTVTLVFPLFEQSSGAPVSLFARLVDKIASLGYIETAGPFIYGRDYQVVKREIVLFKIKIPGS